MTLGSSFIVGMSDHTVSNRVMGRGAEKQKRIRELINLMQRNPYLWNHHLPHYTTNKNRALEAAAKQLGEAGKCIVITEQNNSETMAL